MIDTDRQLIERGVPVPQRLILAWFYLTKGQTLHYRDWDDRFGPYELPNLHLSICDWYVERFPDQATIGHDWGPRLIIIRGEVFQADIPVHFNPDLPLDAFGFIRGLSVPLRESLSPV